MQAMRSMMLQFFVMDNNL